MGGDGVGGQDAHIAVGMAGEALPRLPLPALARVQTGRKSNTEHGPRETWAMTSNSRSSSHTRLRTMMHEDRLSQQAPESR
jgi:hypothetical protein